MEETIQTQQEVTQEAATARKTRKVQKPSQTPAPAPERHPSDLSIFEQLFYIQQHLAVGKTEKNETEGFPYRTEEAILAALRPLLADVRCILYFKDEIVDLCPNYIYLKTTCTLVNAAGEVVEIPGYAREDVILPGHSMAQITGACSTYAHKYALKSMFGLAGENVKPERDPDAEPPVPESAQTHVTEKPRQSNPQTAPVPQIHDETPAPADAPAPSGLIRGDEKPLITPMSRNWNKTVMTVAKQRGTHTREEYSQWVRKTYTISDGDLELLLRMAGKIA